MKSVLKNTKFRSSFHKKYYVKVQSDSKEDELIVEDIDNVAPESDVMEVLNTGFSNC